MVGETGRGRSESETAEKTGKLKECETLGSKDKHEREGRQVEKAKGGRAKLGPA